MCDIASLLYITKGVIWQPAIQNMCDIAPQLYITERCYMTTSICYIMMPCYILLHDIKEAGKVVQIWLHSLPLPSDSSSSSSSDSMLRYMSASRVICITCILLLWSLGIPQAGLFGVISAIQIPDYGREETAGTKHWPCDSGTH